MMTTGWIKIWLGGIICTLLLSACLTGRGYTDQSRPRPGQLQWVDEEILQVGVFRLLEGARLASREPGIVERYAGMLRYWYGVASGNGEDVDGGVRALNYLRAVHFSQQGGKDLWKQAVEAAKRTDVSREGLSARPIPADYR
ncbi:MAG: hypothetical protein GX564_06190 [Oligosphaeraceae bacterium]|nr:hypothetical protein [Oligosphaeraceae bacterium]